jgi:hypothetical protein
MSVARGAPELGGRDSRATAPTNRNLKDRDFVSIMTSNVLAIYYLIKIRH